MNQKLSLLIAANVLLLVSNCLAEPNDLKDFSENSASEKMSSDRVEPGTPLTEPEDFFTARLRNRATPLPPPQKLDPSRANDPDYVAEMWWEHLGYASKQEAAESLKAMKKDAEEAGLKWTPREPGDPYHVEDTFDMPQNELLQGCTYAPGYTYPGNCLDTKGNIIFDASVDGQDVLDKIAKKQGKTKGKYNKMPKVKPKSTVSETFYIND